MIRLRPLTEDECYARCYGGSDPTVTISRSEPRRPRFETTVYGAAHRKSLEERHEERHAADDEAAQQREHRAPPSTC